MSEPVDQYRGRMAEDSTGRRGTVLRSWGATHIPNLVCLIIEPHGGPSAAPILGNDLEWRILPTQEVHSGPVGWPGYNHTREAGCAAQGASLAIERGECERMGCACQRQNRP